MRESSPSILKLDKSLSHLRNLRANLNITKMQSLYKCTEGVVAKLSQRRQNKQLQTMIWFSVNLNTHVFIEAEILFPIPKDQDQIRKRCAISRLIFSYVKLDTKNRSKYHGSNGWDNKNFGGRADGCRLANKDFRWKH